MSGDHAASPDRHGVVTINGRIWNPLEDDGDAFRLAVACGITIHLFNDEIHAECCDWKVGLCSEPRNTDATAAARRAIVRMAAKLSLTSIGTT